MAGQDIEFTAHLRAEDEITPAATAAAEALDKLEGHGDVRVDIEAAGAEDAAEDVTEVEEGIEAVDGTTATAEVETDADTSGLDDTLEGLDEVDGATATAEVVTEGDTSGADAVKDALDEVEATDTKAQVTIEVPPGQVEALQAALKSIPDSKVIQVRYEDGGAPAAIDKTTQKMTALGQATDIMSAASLTGSKALGAVGKVAAGAAIPIAGVVTVAKKSADAFTNLGREVSKLAPVVGMSTEELSRWVAVADDMGVSSKDLATGMVGLEKNAVKGSDAFAAYGIATHDASGAMRPMNEIMLDTIGTINGLEDPTAQAEAGLALMGRGFKGLAPLIGSTEEELRSYLDSVSQGQVITEKEAAKAEEMAQAQDNLKDSLTEVILVVGEMVVALAPLIDMIARVVGVIGDALGWLTDLGSKIGDAASSALDSIPAFAGMADAIGESGGVIPAVVDGFKGLFTNEEEAAAQAEAASQAFIDQGVAMAQAGKGADEISTALTDAGASAEQVDAAMIAVGDAAGTMAQQELAAEAATKAEAAAAKEAAAAEKEHAAAAKDAQSAIKDHAAAIEDEISVLEDEKAALEEAMKASQEKSDAMRASADAQFALTDAQIGFNDSLADLDKNLKDASGNTLKTKKVYDDLAQSAGGVADSQVRLAQETATANGETLTATQSLAAWNKSMLDQAASSPKASAAILGYVAQVNKIPAAKMTAIEAAIKAGDIEKAEGLLNDVSKNRDATLTLDADTAQVAIKTDEAVALAEDAEALMTLAADPDAALATIGKVEDGTYGADILTTSTTKPATTAINAAAAAKYTADIKTGATVAPASTAIKSTAGAAYTADIGTNAQTGAAATALLNFIAQSRIAPIYAEATNTANVNATLSWLAETRTAPINAEVRGASSAEATLNNLARPRSASINTTVRRTEVLTRVDGA